MYYTYVDSPVGPFFVAGDQHAIAFTGFNSGYQQRVPQHGWREDARPLAYAVEQLEAYFAGASRVFDIPLAPTGTEFQLTVWEALRAIPFGQTRSYADIAKAVGNPGASRAVGAANRANHLPVVIPCHRVIGADGDLTGFGGGLDTKRVLLELEGALAPDPQSSLF